MGAQIFPQTFWYACSVMYDLDIVKAVFTATNINENLQHEVNSSEGGGPPGPIANKA